MFRKTIEVFQEIITSIPYRYTTVNLDHPRRTGKISFTTIGPIRGGQLIVWKNHLNRVPRSKDLHRIRLILGSSSRSGCDLSPDGTST